MSKYVELQKEIGLLNAETAEKRLANLRALLESEKQAPEKKPEFANNHIHTTYSFSPYSPTAAIYMARAEGLETAGIILSLTTNTPKNSNKIIPTEINPNGFRLPRRGSSPKLKLPPTAYSLCLYSIFGPAYYVILILRVKLTEISAPAPYSYDKIGMILRVSLCLEQSVSVDGVDLKLMSAKLNKRLDELRHLLFSLLVTENGIVKLYCERTSVAHL